VGGIRWLDGARGRTHKATSTRGDLWGKHAGDPHRRRLTGLTDNGSNQRRRHMKHLQETPVATNTTRWIPIQPGPAGRAEKGGTRQVAAMESTMAKRENPGTGASSGSRSRGWASCKGGARHGRGHGDTRTGRSDQRAGELREVEDSTRGRSKARHGRKAGAGTTRAEELTGRDHGKI
jgi:hypothetical protein